MISTDFFSRSIFKFISTNLIKIFFIICFLFYGLSIVSSQCDGNGVCIPGQIEAENERTTELANTQAETANQERIKNAECGGTDNYNCYTLLEGFGSEGDKVTTVDIGPATLGTYLEQIMTYFLMIVTIAAVFFMIYGGILYLTSDIVNKKAEGREVITRVVIGLIFVFSVWTIMNSINSGLLKNSLDFSLKGIGAAITGAVTGSTPPSGSSPTPGGTAPGTTLPTNPTTNNPPATVTRSCPEGLETISGPFQLCKTVAQNMKNLIEAAKADGVTLTLASAYRSANSGSVTGGTAAADGKSMHQRGLAVDFGGNFKYGPATDKRFIWLVNNASKYGFYNTLYTTRRDEYNHWSTSGR